MRLEAKESSRIRRNGRKRPCGCSIPTEKFQRTKTVIKRDSICQSNLLPSLATFSALHKFQARKNAQASYAPEAPLNPTMAGQLGRLNAPNGTLHKFIAKEVGFYFILRFDDEFRLQ